MICTRTRSQLRVLVASIPFPQNRFLLDLNNALSELCFIEQSSDAFWNKSGTCDIVHLHFPEYLTFKLATAYAEGLTESLIADVAERLDWWSKRARLVITRHVLLPHGAKNDPLWEELYSVFYSYSDAVVHFGHASETEFKQRYADLVFNRGKPPVHSVIPHANYNSLPNRVTREEARKRLGISPRKKVMLVFGAVRSDDERNLILQTFDGVNTPDKVLLVSRWRENPIPISWIRAQNWIKSLRRAYYRFHPEYVFNYDFVAEEETDMYLNAADVLFIPRLRVLNSGNVTLGMTFGRVVVGPDSWDVGELLTENGNPVFNPDQPSTAARAMEEGFRLADRGAVPASNRLKALAEWQPAQCARQYADLFTHLTSIS